MKILNLYPGSFGSNCYVLLSGTHAAIIDPSANAQTVLDAVKEAGASVDMILLTHGHFDHILSLDELRDACGAPVYIHREDAEMLPDAEKNAFYYFFRTRRTWQAADHMLSDGDVLPLGDEEIRVIHTPGHSRGSVLYRCSDALFTGDTLFDGNYGRYDLYGGNGEDLFRSLSSMRALPGSLTIYPGHGGAQELCRALDLLGL